MGTDLALRPLSRPLAPFGLRVCPAMLDAALVALEHGHSADRELDADIYAALGWEVDRAPVTRVDRAGWPVARRRLGWRCRSPMAAGWEILPSPTSSIDAASKLVPFRWSWGVSLDAGAPRAWCREDRVRRGHDLARFSEISGRLSAPRALAAAALFAHRQIVMEG